MQKESREAVNGEATPAQKNGENSLENDLVPVVLIQNTEFLAELSAHIEKSTQNLENTSNSSYKTNNEEKNNNENNHVSDTDHVIKSLQNKITKESSTETLMNTDEETGFSQEDTQITESESNSSLEQTSIVEENLLENSMEAEDELLTTKADIQALAIMDQNTEQAETNPMDNISVVQKIPEEIAFTL
ncbi:10846_t:CDS:2, partial [Racocetra persica]